MALVADYSDSDDEEVLNGSEEDGETPAKIEDHVASNGQDKNVDGSEDEDDRELNQPASSILDEEAFEDTPGLSDSSSLFSQLHSAAPKVKGGASDSHKNFIDGKALASLRPLKPDPTKRKKIKIGVPSLSEFDDDDDEDNTDGASKRLKFANRASSSSSLLSLLPQPKKPVPQKQAKRPLIPHSLTKKSLPAISKLPPKPAQVKNATRNVQSDFDSDDGEEGGVNSFFTLEAEKVVPTFEMDDSAKSAVKIGRVNANPHAVGPSDRPLDFKGNNKSSTVTSFTSDVSELSVGPSKPTAHDYGAYAYPEAEDLMANTEAIERLAGKHAQRRKEDINIVDVSANNLTSDPREWLTKALTEGDSDKPGPKCEIKGEKKRKHQITYLAALAKENEHKLREQWAQNASSKRAAGAKYGFF